MDFYRLTWEVPFPSSLREAYPSKLLLNRLPNFFLAYLVYKEALSRPSKHTVEFADFVAGLGSEENVRHESPTILTDGAAASVRLFCVTIHPCIDLPFFRRELIRRCYLGIPWIVGRLPPVIRLLSLSQIIRLRRPPRRMRR